MEHSATDSAVLAITVESAARKLGLSRATLYRLANDDPTFPVIRQLGKLRCTRIRLDELSAWLDAQRGDKNGASR